MTERDMAVDGQRASHVLVLVAGERPTDVFERAVVRLGDERRLPHAIHVVGSPATIARVRRTLLTRAGAYRFSQLCARVGFPRDEILFNQRTVHALALVQEDCVAGADRLLDLLRRLSGSADDSCLTIVVADDAGVAGHVVQACLQVVGRTSDRLLVDCSTRGPRARKANARVPECRHLEIPLLLWPANEPVPPSYTEAVRIRRRDRQRVARPDLLRLDRRRRLVSVGETSLTLPAMQFFWLYYLASTSGERLPLGELTARFVSAMRPHPFPQKLADGRVRSFPDDLRRVFVQLFPHAADKFDAMCRRACGPHPGLPSTVSKINAGLRRALGRGAAPYLIEGGRGAGGYRITLPPSAIELLGAEGRHP